MSKPEKAKSIELTWQSLMKELAAMIEGTSNPDGVRRWGCIFAMCPLNRTDESSTPLRAR